MKSPCCLYVWCLYDFMFHLRLKAIIVEPKETVFARQLLSKLVPAATKRRTRTQFFDACFLHNPCRLKYIVCSKMKFGHYFLQELLVGFS
jgi:hypothetical protein